jgi:hypothetical protein
VNIGINFRHELAGATPAVLKELEALIAGISGWTNTEHNDEGGHGDVTATSLAITAPRRGTALDVASGMLKFAGGLAGSRALTPDTLTADANDYSPPNIQDAFIVRIQADSVHTITGIQDGPRRIPMPGRILLLFNAGSYAFELSQEDTASQANFRFRLPGFANVTVPPNECILLYYDATSARWLVLASTSGVLPSSLEYDAGDSGAAITIDWADGPQQIVNLTDNAVIDFLNPVKGQEYRLIFKEDGAGGFSPSFGAEVDLQNSVDPTALSAGESFMLDMIYTGDGDRYISTFTPGAINDTTEQDSSILHWIM